MYKNKSLIYLVVFTVLVLSMINTLQHFEKKLLNSEEGIVLEKSNISSYFGDINYRIINAEEPKQIEYVINIEKELFDKIEGENVFLLVDKIAVQAYKVYINDVMVASYGDFESGKSFFHNRTKLINIDKKLLSDNNKLVISTYSADSNGVVKKILESSFKSGSANNKPEIN